MAASSVTDKRRWAIKLLITAALAFTWTVLAIALFILAYEDEAAEDAGARLAQEATQAMAIILWLLGLAGLFIAHRWFSRRA